MQHARLDETATDSTRIEQIADYIRSQVAKVYDSAREYFGNVSPDNKEYFYASETLTPEQIWETSNKLADSPIFDFGPTMIKIKGDKDVYRLDDEYRFETPHTRLFELGFLELSKTLKSIAKLDIENSIKSLAAANFYFGQYRGNEDLVQSLPGKFAAFTGKKSVPIPLFMKRILGPKLGHYFHDLKRLAKASEKKDMTIACAKELGWGQQYTLTEIPAEVRKALLKNERARKIGVYAEDKIYEILRNAGYPKKR